MCCKCLSRIMIIERDLLQCQNQNKSGCFLLFQITFSSEKYYVGHSSKKIAIIHTGAVCVHLCHVEVQLTLIIPRITAVADFEQRWRQRGKTADCSFKHSFNQHTSIHILKSTKSMCSAGPVGLVNILTILILDSPLQIYTLQNMCATRNI